MVSRDELTLMQLQVDEVSDYLAAIHMMAAAVEPESNKAALQRVVAQTEDVIASIECDLIKFINQ